MDPSFSVSNDPHQPHPLTAFPPFNTSNPFVVQNHTFYGGASNTSAVAPTSNNYLYQAPQTPSVSPHLSFTHPPYSDMICTAIAALNEPDGSSKQAISTYIERIYTGLPPSHGALLTHHLKTLKSSGILLMVKKSYKFAATTPPTSVAVAAAAAAAAGLEPPRSDFTSNIVNDNQLSSTPQTQKRGRGRPPKVKHDVQQSNIVHTNGNSSWQQNESPVSRSEEIIPQPPSQSLVKRPRGRPRKDGSASPIVKASPSGGLETVKRRGRPPSVRAVGRERKPIVVSAPASVFPYVANGGVRRRGRPKRVDSVASPQPLNTVSGGQELGIVVAKRRGRPPKIGGVMRKPMKPFRGYIRTGKPRGRPRKNAVSLGASGQQNAGYEELKKKFELFQEKAKEIVDVLKGEIGGSENQAVVEAIQALEELSVTTKETPTDEAEPQHMEEMEPEEEYRETEPEPAGEGEEQTEAEAMQEALF